MFVYHGLASMDLLLLKASPTGGKQTTLLIAVHIDRNMSQALAGFV